MKKNIFEVSKEERYRILEMHENRTSNHYLMNEQGAQPENQQGSQPENDTTCTSETVNITDEIQIKKGANQTFTTSKTVTPNILLERLRSNSGSNSRMPLLIVRNIGRLDYDTKETSYTQKVKGFSNRLQSTDNVWLQKIEYFKISERMTLNGQTKDYSLDFPSFITFAHMFCAKFKNADKIGNIVDIKSAESGSQVYRYYRIPIRTKSTVGINQPIEKNSLMSKLVQTFYLSGLGNIPQLMFGDGYVPSVSFLTNDVMGIIADEIIKNSQHTVTKPK